MKNNANNNNKKNEYIILHKKNLNKICETKALEIDEQSLCIFFLLLLFQNKYQKWRIVEQK